MLVYDITNEKSFDNIRNWIRNIEEVRVWSRDSSGGGAVDRSEWSLFCSTPRRTWRG